MVMKVLCDSDAESSGASSSESETSVQTNPEPNVEYVLLLVNFIFTKLNCIN